MDGFYLSARMPVYLLDEQCDGVQLHAKNTEEGTRDEAAWHQLPGNIFQAKRNFASTSPGTSTRISRSSFHWYKVQDGAVEAQSFLYNKSTDPYGFK
jgi:hypothetical protein